MNEEQQRFPNEEGSAFGDRMPQIREDGAPAAPITQGEFKPVSVQAVEAVSMPPKRRHSIANLMLMAALGAMMMAGAMVGVDFLADDPPPAAANPELESEHLYVSAPRNPADDLAELRERQDKIQRTLSEVSPAVVSITDGVGSGSGVIVSADGYILTAGHVLLTEATEVTVTLWDGTNYRAEPLGRNLNIDAGLAKITDEGPFPFVEMANTNAIQPGDWCLALGHPGGYQLGRTPPLRVGRLIEKADWMLVTDCTLVGGDSGGPLFDLDGKLIGIHSSIGPSVAENRHVRIDGFETSWDRMAEGEAWGRLGGVGPLDRDSAYLGVSLDMDADEALVVDILEGSAAAEAGVEIGDVVLEIDGRAVSDSQQLIAQVAEKRAGRQFTLRVRRDGKRIRLRGRFGRAGED